MRGLFCAAFVGFVLAVFAVPGAADEGSSAIPRVLELRFTATSKAQMAIWIERADGEFLSTVRLTEAVALRGIGNRPGASQMNSGFRWPYGRREGALPIWARRRASAPSAQPFRRVIFQDRKSEGFAGRTSIDSSYDDYYCLSLTPSRSTKDALDAVSCASVFNSDKGRFITEDDVARDYAEPYELPATQEPHQRSLSLFSLYPPRRDVTRCETTSCDDHADIELFAAHARDVMPDIDAVTMATLAGGVPQNILYALPPDWEPGDYRACVEINVEGDHNDTFSEHAHATPAKNPDCNGQFGWDSWAMCFGYPYRGQPSVVYCADFRIDSVTEQRVTAAQATGSAGSWDDTDPAYGELHPVEGMTDDPVAAPGSGADRLLQTEEGHRLEVMVRHCERNQPPSAIENLSISRHPDELNAHQWARLRFEPATDDVAVFRYDVRISTHPITDDRSFVAAMPAKEATIESVELRVPVDAEASGAIEVEMGGMVASTHYSIAVRAMDDCAGVGPIRTTELSTPARIFSTVTPCFVATAAFHNPLATEVRGLRRFRDRQLLSHRPGRALVAAYYAVSPSLAELIRVSEPLRTIARVALRPAITVARWLRF